MRQGTQGWCTGMTLRDGLRWEGGSGWGTHVHPWVIYVSVWQNPLKYCKVISHQLNKLKSKKKIRDSKGTFDANIGTRKDIEGTDLIETENIKKRQQEYTKELTKKVLMTQIVMMV